MKSMTNDLQSVRNSNGYFKKEDIDKMLAGVSTLDIKKINK